MSACGLEPSVRPIACCAYAVPCGHYYCTRVLFTLRRVCTGRRELVLQYDRIAAVIDVALHKTQAAKAMANEQHSAMGGRPLLPGFCTFSFFVMASYGGVEYAVYAAP